MGLKTLPVTIEEDNRDKGKTFILTEFPASKAEKWAYRAFLAMTRSGVSLPDNVTGLGMVGIGMLGMKAFFQMHYEDAEPLLDEMFTAVAIQPDPFKNPNYTRAIVEEDIEEVKTRVVLRMKILELHTGFSFADVLSKLTPTTNLSAD